MWTFILRYGVDLLLLTILLWFFIRTGKTKAQKRRRLKVLYRRVAPISIVFLFFCFYAVPILLGPYFHHARYLPQILEAHKLRLYWQIACIFPGVKPSADNIQQAIDEVAAEYTMHPDLIRALVQVESSNNQFAISSVGACGLTQVMPNTYYSLGRGNPFALKANLRAGTKYIRHLYRRFDGNLELALAAYNAGPGTIARHRKVPNGPVHQYVVKVTRLYRYYRKKNRKAT